MVAGVVITVAAVTVEVTNSGMVDGPDPSKEECPPEYVTRSSGPPPRRHGDGVLSC